MVVKALLVALIAGLCKIDNRIFGMTMLQRPLLVGTLVGIVYGDPVAGMMFGAQFELLSMGLVGIGAHSGMLFARRSFSAAVLVQKLLWCWQCPSPPSLTQPAT